MIAIVLGADRLPKRVRYLAPALDHVKRLIEGVRVLDLHQNFELAAVAGELVALDHMLLFGMRGPVPVEIAVAGGAPDGVDHQDAVRLIMTNRLAKP